MSRRKITQIIRNGKGELIAFSNPAQFWSPVYKEQIIKEIESGLHKYFIEINGQSETEILVGHSDGIKTISISGNTNTSKGSVGLT